MTIDFTNIVLWISVAGNIWLLYYNWLLFAEIKSLKEALKKAIHEVHKKSVKELAEGEFFK